MSFDRALSKLGFAVATICTFVSIGHAESDNYGNPELLPGEKVVTPTGQTIKVWSTEGPVKVSPPPQPFDDPSKQRLDASGVIVDDRPGMRREVPVSPRMQPPAESGPDKFDGRFELPKEPK